MARPKKYPIILSDADIHRLETVIAKEDCSKTVRSRCRILLDLDENKGKALTHEQCAEVNCISAATVTNIVRLYHNGGVEKVVALNRNENSNNGRYRPARCAEEKALEIARGQLPSGQLRWVLRFMRQPARIELEIPQSDDNGFRYSLPKEKAELAAGMEDILGIYETPYHPMRPVVCMGEKTIPLSDETSGPGYGCGAFMVMEPLGSKRHARIRENRTACDWAEEIKYITDVMYPDAEKIILVPDNTNTHAPASLYKRFPPEEAARILKRLEIHYTPKGGSWLNIAEIELNVMTHEFSLCKVNSMEKVQRELKAWECGEGKTAACVEWHLSVCEARSELAMLYPDVLSI